MISEVLAQRQTTVGIQVRQHLNLGEEISIFVRTFYKVFSITFLPPVVHISILVIATSLVVKSVSHLMTDYDTDSTIVKSIVSRRVKERNLQYTSREADFVRGRIIVSVDRLWSHVPVVPVNRFSSRMVYIPFQLPAATLTHILIVSFFRIYCQARQILPTVRISYLDIERIQLQQGIDFGRIIHPVLGSNTLTQGHFQIIHQCLHALLRGCREVLLDIDSSKSLTHDALHLIGGTTPQRMIFLATREHLAIEFKSRSTRSIVQDTGSIVYDAPLHHITVFCCSHRCKNLVSSLHECRLSDNHFLDMLAFDACGISLLFQLEVRIARVELRQCHLVVIGNGVAQLGSRLRHLSQCRLNLHDVLHLLLCRTFLVAEELEHIDDILLVGLTNLDGGLVVFHVVVFLAQRKSALADVQDILRSVLLVCANVGVKELLFTVGSHLQLYLKQLLLVFGSIQFLQQGHYRSQSVLFPACGVHSQFVEVAQFLLNRALRVAVLQQFLQDTVDTLVVVLGQTVETAIARIGCRQRVVLHPATAGILIEVVCRPYTGIKVVKTDTRPQLC